MAYSDTKFVTCLFILSEILTMETISNIELEACSMYQDNEMINTVTVLHT